MADPFDKGKDGNTLVPSLWEREPDLVILEIATWEHAVCVPGSWGKVDRVADLKRLLPHELTAPIYALLERAEALFLKRTEPIPPFRERLARDFEDRGAMPGAEVTVDADCFTVERELRELLSSGRTLDEVLPGWDQAMADVLGADAERIALSIRNFASLGLPIGEFSLSYGYKVDVRRIPGRLLRPALATHGTLLMGCIDAGSQPGPRRELIDRVTDRLLL